MFPARYSIPFFAVSNFDVMVDALTGTWNETDNPKKYEPVSTLEYIDMRAGATY